MVEIAELRRVPVFADLPDDQLAWFICQAEEVRLKPGDAFFLQGTPADAMFVILEGETQSRGELGGETVTVSGKAGDVTGVLPF